MSGARTRIGLHDSLVAIDGPSPLGATAIASLAQSASPRRKRASTVERSDWIRTTSAECRDMSLVAVELLAPFM